MQVLANNMAAALRPFIGVFSPKDPSVCYYSVRLTRLGDVTLPLALTI